TPGTLPRREILCAPDRDPGRREPDGQPGEGLERDPGDESLRRPEPDREQRPRAGDRPCRRRGRGGRAGAAGGGHECGGEDGKYGGQPGDAKVGQRLYVDVLDAVPPLPGREGGGRLVRELSACRRNVPLEGIWVVGAFPPDSEQRAVEEDPDTDVGKRRSLRLRLDLFRPVRIGLLTPEKALERAEVGAAHHERAG